MCKERFTKDFWGDRASIPSSTVLNGFASVAGIAARDNQQDLLRRDPSKELEIAHACNANTTVRTVFFTINHASLGVSL